MAFPARTAPQNQAASLDTGKLAAIVEKGRAAQSEDADERLARDLLIFASALMFFVPMLWLVIYRSFGQSFSSTVPLVCLGASAVALIAYYRTRNFRLLALLQLGLWLFAPFVMQWSIGNFVDSSGVVLWASMAPVGALVFLGAPESIPWFFAYTVLMALSGFFDYFLAVDATTVPMPTRISRRPPLGGRYASTIRRISIAMSAMRSA